MILILLLVWLTPIILIAILNHPLACLPSGYSNPGHASLFEHDSLEIPESGISPNFS